MRVLSSMLSSESCTEDFADLFASIQSTCCVQASDCVKQTRKPIKHDRAPQSGIHQLHMHIDCEQSH